jgi:integrase
MEARNDGTPQRPSKPPFALMASHAPAAPKARNVAPLTISGLFEEYALASRMTSRNKKEWRSSVARLIAFVGHDDARRLTTDNVFDWRDALLGETTVRGGLRDPVTVKGKYIGAVKAMLNWAVSERRLSINVATVVPVTIQKKPKLRERAFTMLEAQTILTATLEPASTRMAPGNRLARRWVPWLCAYTGARVGEMGQLRREDVKEVEGLWVLNITPDAGTIKTNEARVVPIHSHLIEQGFIAMVAKMPKGPLFYDPKKQRVDGEDTRHSNKVGEKLALWVRKDLRITDDGIAPNHGWRHLFKTLSAEAGVEERIANLIQGHAAGTVSRTYIAGSRLLPTMAKGINGIPRFEVLGV